MGSLGEALVSAGIVGLIGVVGIVAALVAELLGGE